MSQQLTNKQQTKTSVKQNKTTGISTLTRPSDQQNHRNSTLVFSMRLIESQGFSTLIFHQKHRITGVFNTDFPSEQTESQELRPDCLQQNRQNQTKFRPGLFYQK